MKNIQKRLVVILLVSVGIATAYISATIYQINAAEPRDSATIYRQLSLFGEAFEQVRDVYVDVPDEKILIENAIKGMLTGLDPHSDYLNAEEFERMQTSTASEFGGLGIQFTMEDGLVKIITTIDDTPAANAGLRGGDYITHINGASTKGLSSQEAADRMRGEVSTKINLTIFRPTDEGKSFDVDIIRDLIENNPVTMRLEDKVIYLRISQFNAKADQQLQKAVDKALKDLPLEQADGVILDLRNNGGGYLNQAVNISDLFLNQGEIVTTRGREISQIERHPAREGDVAGGKPLIVLINGGSASASEIVAGALQDHKRATLIGTRSFGKGSVQRIIPIDQGLSGALRITTGRYYTPSGRSIQAKGIAPDIKVDQPLPDNLSADQVSIGGEVSLRGHIEATSEGGTEDQTEPGQPADETQNTNNQNTGKTNQSADGDKTSLPSSPGTDEAGKTTAEEYNSKGSPAYVPREAKDDTQLQYALKLLRGEETNEKFIN